MMDVFQELPRPKNEMDPVDIDSLFADVHNLDFGLVHWGEVLVCLFLKRPKSGYWEQLYICNNQQILNV